MQVRSPAGHSGLRIPCCHSYGIGSNCGLDPIPGPRTPYAAGVEKRGAAGERMFFLSKLREGMFHIGVLSSVLRKKRISQRNILILVFQVPLDQNNQLVKLTYFGVACFFFFF